MPPLFEELDFCTTPIGDLSLRRRHDLRLGQDVYEIKLGEEFLMSSAFTASEDALADLGVGACEGEQLDIVIGGLGLGHTAVSALKNPRVRELLVIDKLEDVIRWHEEGLLPLSATLTGDSRCRLIAGDFFALCADKQGFDPVAPGRRFDAILVDIDHSPDFFLDPSSESFYGVDGLRGLSAHLKPGGIFGLWSNDPPDEAFTAKLGEVFGEAWGEPVSFHNPLRDCEETQAVYLARWA